jgi:DNA-binding transcriptional MerR regulator
MAAERTHLSIGEVLTLLQPEFPDVTISKIRFLESQGLLDPERTPSGYRKFHDDDIERLRWILTQQRDHFLPLKVIKDRLSSGDLQGGDGVLPLAADGAGESAPPPASADQPDQQEGSEAPDLTSGDAAAAVTSDDDAAAVTTVDGPTEAPDGEPEAPDGAAPVIEEVTEAVADVEGDVGASGEDWAGAGSDEDGPAEAGAPESTATGRASLTLLRRAGVVSPDTPDPEVATPDGDEHDRAEAVAHLVEVPEEAQADSTAAARGRGRRRHPTGRLAGEAPPPPDPLEPDRPEPLEPAQTVSLSLEELSAATGLSARDVGELERYGLIASRVMGTVRYYDDEALVVARLAAGFGRYGIEARHLRMYKVSAEREAGLFEQLITPLLKQRRASARQEAVAMLEDLAELADDLRAAMVRSALRDYLGRQ